MIRKATSEDMPILLEMERRCFADRAYTGEQIRWFLNSENSATFISFRENRVAGSMMLSLRGRRGKVVSVGVMPEWRGKGIGKELMVCAEEWFSTSGVREVDLEVNVNNHEATIMYSSLGYRKVRILKKYYQGREDAYLMRKKLPKVK
ncbi:MAG: GNAT family N-acetyltransferase [Methanobacteriota archaeon]|nr:MAG: GNAT family N-acetyltransferase [Euryarchaeota archaeon]